MGDERMSDKKPLLARILGFGRPGGGFNSMRPAPGVQHPDGLSRQLRASYFTNIEINLPSGPPEGRVVEVELGGWLMPVGEFVGLPDGGWAFRFWTNIPALPEPDPQLEPKPTFSQRIRNWLR